MLQIGHGIRRESARPEDLERIADIDAVVGTPIQVDDVELTRDEALFGVHRDLAFDASGARVNRHFARQLDEGHQPVTAQDLAARGADHRLGCFRRDPRDLIPKETREGLRKIAESLGVEWLEAPTAPAAVVNRRPGAGMSDDQMEVVIEEKIPVFAAGLGNPGPWVERLKANGTKVLSLVGNVKNAKRVAASGVDIVVAQGTEAGGHTGRIATFALVPQVVDAVSPVPVVAAGGIGDGRGLAAALALGAIGVWGGTAVLVSNEANQPDVQKERILAAMDEDTRITKLYSGKTMRNITNPLIEAWDSAGIAALPMGLQGLLVGDLLYSVRKAGRPELLMNAAGQVAGLLKESRPAGDILRDMVSGAADILARKLPATVQAVPA